MSDVFEGPGWWMASDGKWYPPNRHPDASYRGQFQTQPESAGFPAVGLHEEHEAETTPASTFNEMVINRSAQLDETAEISGPELADHLEQVEQQRRQGAQREAARKVGLMQSEAPPQDVPERDVEELEAAENVPERFASEESVSTLAVEPMVQRETALAPSRTIPSEVRSNPMRGFSVASPDFTDPPARPVFDGAAPPSVVGAPDRPPSVSGRTRLEFQTPSTLTTADPVSVKAEVRKPSTSLVHVPSPVIDVPTTQDRIVASLIFISGVALIIGTFLEWTVAPVAETGWTRRDGIATLLAGVIGSAMAGPIFIGFRHTVPKAIAIIVGLLAIVVVGPVAISGDDYGVGFFVVGGAATVMVLAAAAGRGE